MIERAERYAVLSTLTSSQSVYDMRRAVWLDCERVIGGIRSHRPADTGCTECLLGGNICVELLHSQSVHWTLRLLFLLVFRTRVINFLRLS